MSRRNRTKDEDLPPITLAVKDLIRSTEATYSAIVQVERAFLLGLWYKSFPDYTLEHLEKAYGWNHKELMPENASVYDEPYENFLRFQFAANTGDSWHQCYRDFRERGWQRLKVHRDGGRLQYLLKLEDNFTWAHEGEAGAQKVYDKPEGFRELHLLLDISISTCKQVQIGTEMKEVPIMKTVCEDLVEMQENDSAESVSEVIPLVVVDDIEELQNRRSGEAADSYEAEHGPEGQIPRKSEYSGSDSIFDYERALQQQSGNSDASKINSTQCAHGYFAGRCTHTDCVYYDERKDDIPF